MPLGVTVGGKARFKACVFSVVESRSFRSSRNEDGRLAGSVVRRLRIGIQRELARLRSVLSYRRRELTLRHTPLQIWVEPTNKCNLRCVMCINAAATKAHSGFMDLALYRSIIDQAAGWRPRPIINLFLGGESTLHRQLLDMIRYADQSGLETALATNATTLSPERSRRLIESGLANIIFSFDCYDRPSFEAVRVGADFGRTVDNIRAFLEIKQELRTRGPRVTLYSLVTRSADAQTERDRLHAFQQTFAGLPIDEFKIELAGHWAGTFDGINTADFQEAVRYGDRFLPCFRLWESMSILWDGTVVPCCVDFLGELPLGDSRTQPLLEIWNGVAMLAHRRRMIAQAIEDVSLCTKGTRGCEVPWPTETLLATPIELLPHSVIRTSKAFAHAAQSIMRFR